MNKRRRHVNVAAFALVATVGLGVIGPSAISAKTFPSTLSDQEFWKLVVSFSEPGGRFRSSGAIRTDNLISNEAGFQQVIPALTPHARRGAYLGVGPEQNLTYVVALKPTIAFIIDIRRQNMLLHLMYKAIVEMSTDRADFLSYLFAQPRPAAAGDDMSIQSLLEMFRTVPGSEDLAMRNVRAIDDRLERRHGFRLSDDDKNSIADAYEAFRLNGPNIRWDTSGDSWIPSYADLMTQTDLQGHPHSFLASEDNFRVIKEYETANRIVPLVGDFAGNRTIRAVGRYLRDHDTTVAAFYTSNVEGYLFQGDLWRKFFMNVSTLPIDEQSIFVRTDFTVRGVAGGFTVNGFIGARPQYETSPALDPIWSLLRAFRRGDIRTPGDLRLRSKMPT
jgi:hypothetical protein